jgi:hypothetical protein
MSTRKTKNPSKLKSKGIASQISNNIPNNPISIVNIPTPSAQTWSVPSSGMTGYAKPVERHVSTEDHYSIQIFQSIHSQNRPSSLNLKFFSEEEFVFSFVNMYNDLSKGEKYSITSNSVINIENINEILLHQYLNGVKMLISPFYVLKKAKELNYE